jgi:hypothetical protein
VVEETALGKLLRTSTSTTSLTEDNSTLAVSSYERVRVRERDKDERVSEEKQMHSHGKKRIKGQTQEEEKKLNKSIKREKILYNGKSTLNSSTSRLERDRKATPDTVSMVRGE